jgi:hypothetical protein
LPPRVEDHAWPSTLAGPRAHADHETGRRGCGRLAVSAARLLGESAAVVVPVPVVVAETAVVPVPVVGAETAVVPVPIVEAPVVPVTVMVTEAPVVPVPVSAVVTVVIVVVPAGVRTVTARVCLAVVAVMAASVGEGRRGSRPGEGRGRQTGGDQADGGTRSRHEAVPSNACTPAPVRVRRAVRVPGRVPRPHTVTHLRGA